MRVTLIVVMLLYLSVGSSRRILPRYRIRNVTASAKALLTRYFDTDLNDPAARPVADDSKAVDVNFKFDLTGVRLLDIVTHRLTVTALMCSFWKEPRVRWSKRTYGNISAIRATSTMIWMPDIQPPAGRAIQVQMKESVALLDYRGSAIHCAFSELSDSPKLVPWFDYEQHYKRFPPTGSAAANG
ncbi:acetylcholine receptor subunit beta-like [Tropilaelaps mercedesae]|uniref:Acetylcholine receptor subunit beta-like n=1 Tax=Tropilaelaps mercedesae TaxID=418985 RepID=A0A1V9X0B9_9ACAR|nr:acetylcholine receptor subunit beta-like [Tropilaelaps mercedesae]